MRTTQIGRRWARELKVTAVLLAAERRKDGGGGDDAEGCVVRTSYVLTKTEE